MGSKKSAKPATRTRRRKPARKRVLKSRQKKASKGQVLRLSDDVLGFLNKKRIGKRKKPPSWDAFFRSVFGISDREGSDQPLVTGWLEVNSGRFFLTKSGANGQAVLEAARRGVKSIDRPIELREVRW